MSKKVAFAETPSHGERHSDMQNRTISSKTRFLSSNLASVTAVTVCFPLEVMKTRMQI